jgi:tetratricopeptide (TPR) repeat protein
VLLDRRRVKFWQKIVFGFMAFLMAAFLVVGYSGVLNGCTWFNSAQQNVTKQLDGQVARYQAAVAADPKDVAAWTSLAESFVRRATLQAATPGAAAADWSEAAKAYRRVDRLLAKQKGAAVRRQRLDALQQLALVYLSLRQYQELTNVYGEITGLRPKDAQSYFNMATAAINAGDKNTALLAFTKFLELDPTSPDAPAVKDWIAKNAPSSSPTPSPSPTK